MLFFFLSLLNSSIFHFSLFCCFYNNRRVIFQSPRFTLNPVHATLGSYFLAAFSCCALYIAWLHPLVLKIYLYLNVFFSISSVCPHYSVHSHTRKGLFSPRYLFLWHQIGIWIFFLQQVSKQIQMRASLWLQPWNYSSASLLWPASTDVCCAFVGGRVGVLMRTVWDLAVFYHCHYDCCLLWMQIARHWLWLLVEMWRWPLQFLLDYISIVCCSHGTFKKATEGDDSLI